MLKQIGKFTISERIGRGTHSRVYRAVDSQSRPAAIKVSTTQTDADHLNQFQKDLVAAASVLHPNLVAVHDLGFEDDFPYLVMELVEGLDLEKLLKSNATVSLAERIRVMQQVGDALKSAHERGIYHLDLRPSKIMLGDDGVAKLLNLGLGRLSYDPARVTEHGYLVGAPFYMSPERLTAIDTANPQCDVWSFGVTFYEWIAGHHPFYDDDGDRMIGNIMDAQPASLAGVPAALNQVILRALEKDPSDRYHNFTELLADIRPMVSDLKREESDALLAEALKQTDSGRWHEARRIARKLRDMEPQQAPSSQMFGFSDSEAESEPPVEPVLPVSYPKPAAAANPVVAAVVSASAAPAVETPDPEPMTVPPPPPIPPPPPVQTTKTPRPQRPERTAPKIPAMGSGAGLRNGAALSENGTPPSVHAKQPEPVTNGARMAAAATVGAAASSVARETRAPAPSPEYTRPRPSATEPTRSAFSSSQRTPRPSPSVRILEESDSSGLPWGRISAFAVAALLILGALFFVVRSDSKLLKPASASEEAKQVGPAERVIKVGSADPATPASSETTAVSQTISPAPTSATPIAKTDPPPALPPVTDPASTIPAPRAFDPKSLSQPKLPVRRRAGSMASLAPPPSFNGNPDVGDLAGLPVAGNAPPPPAPVAVVKPQPVVPSPLAVSTQVPAAESLQASAGRIGGAFAQPVLIHTVQPIYPPSALQRKAQGVVRFQATITKDGSVKNLQLLSGDPLLNVAAKQAVMQWKYRPAVLNGQPVEVTQAIVVRFNLSQ